MSELEAIKAFSDRCNILEIKKFSTTVLQNLEKGSEGLGGILAEMSNTIWMERSNKVRQMGEAASSKLMIPIMIIFIGILFNGNGANIFKHRFLRNIVIQILYQKFKFIITGVVFKQKGGKGHDVKNFSRHNGKILEGKRGF